MIDLLDRQNFALNVHFINTIINCDTVEIQGLFGTMWSTLRWSHFININSILSVNIPLSHQHISVKVLLSDIQTIDGLKKSLYRDEYYQLNKFYFYCSYYKNEYLLRKNIPISFILTKVINQTVLMNNKKSKFNGIFIPLSKFDLNYILLTSEQYIFFQNY